MDPKSTANLDPKLKEAYDRVMGTTLPPASPPASPNRGESLGGQTPVTPSAPPAQAPTQSPPVQVQVQTQPQVQPEAPTDQVPQVAVSANVTLPQVQATTFVATDTQATAAIKTKPKISPVILILGGVVFFVVYALFWIKFFNVSLPFLPQ